MTIWDIFFPVERGISMAAFIGATVLLLNGKKRGRMAMVLVVLVNYLTAVYLTPLVAELADIKHQPGIAFAIGVGGFGLIDKIIDRIFSKMDSNLKIDGNPDSNASTE